jgi:trehalose 6-phosphate synthase
MSPRLIIVSNRVVAPEEADSSLADEMAATVKAALRNQNGMWFGWSGAMTDQPASEPRTHEVNKVTYVQIDCRRATFRNIATGSPIACCGLFSTTASTYSTTPVPTRAATCA